MIQRMMISMAISFVLRQLDKFKGQVDWARVQGDLDERVRAVLPGTWFDDDAVKLVNSLLEAVKYVMSDNNKLKDIMSSLATEDWNGAYNLLKALVLGAWSSGAVASNDQAKLAMMS